MAKPKFVLNRKAFAKQVLQDPRGGEIIVAEARRSRDSIARPHDVSVYQLDEANGRAGALLMCHGSDERRHGSLSQTRGAFQ